MLSDHAINFRHHAAGFGEGDNHSAIVENVFIAQDAAFAGRFATFACTVFQPFFAWSVATHGEGPSVARHVFESTGCVDHHFAVVVLRIALFHPCGACSGKADIRSFEDDGVIGLQQMQRDQFAAQ